MSKFMRHLHLGNKPSWVTRSKCFGGIHSGKKNLHERHPIITQHVLVNLIRNNFVTRVVPNWYQNGTNEKRFKIGTRVGLQVVFDWARVCLTMVHIPIDICISFHA